jgi:hypothetical protein
MQFHFTAPLASWAHHFLEEWHLRRTDAGTDVTRTISLFPKGLLGWLVLWPISLMMKQAFSKQLAELRRLERGAATNKG